MSDDADMMERHSRLLAGLAEVSLAMAEDLQAAMAATTNTKDLVRIAGAFARIGRCLRLAIALEARLRRGEALEPKARVQADREAALDTERPDYGIGGDHGLRPDYENLYEPLPDGDPADVARELAGDLIQTARSLSAPTGRGVRPIPLSRDYAALTRDLVANDPDPPDRPPLAAAAARGPPRR